MSVAKGRVEVPSVDRGYFNLTKDEKRRRRRRRRSGYFSSMEEKKYEAAATDGHHHHLSFFWSQKILEFGVRHFIFHLGGDDKTPEVLKVNCFTHTKKIIR